jgi:hypothetical protein
MGTIDHASDRERLPEQIAAAAGRRGERSVAAPTSPEEAR